MQIDLPVPVQAGQILTPLSQVARLEEGTAPSKIRRLDLMREIRVSANTQGRSLGEVIAEIKQRTSGMSLPPGFRIDYTGESEDMMESFEYVGQSLISWR